jgi:hypothetical protein
MLGTSENEPSLNLNLPKLFPVSLTYVLFCSIYELLYDYLTICIICIERPRASIDGSRYSIIYREYKQIFVSYYVLFCFEYELLCDYLIIRIKRQRTNVYGSK